MTVSEIKSMTEDYRVRGCISHLWDISCYHRMMCDYEKLPTPRELLFDCRSVFLARYEAKEIGPDQCKIEKRILCDFSELVLGDKHGWKEGTVLDDRSVREKTELLYKERAEKYEHYKYLIDTLSLPIPEDINNNPLWHLVRSNELMKAIEHGITTHCVTDVTTLYEFVKGYAERECRNGVSPLFFMRMLSTLACSCGNGNAFRWVDEMDWTGSEKARDSILHVIEKRKQKSSHK